MNPFCLCERDYLKIKDLCDSHNLKLNIYNLWDIEDEDLTSLPTHISTLISKRRNAELPCSIYNDVFVNGNRILIDNENESYLKIDKLIREIKFHEPDNN